MFLGLAWLVLDFGFIWYLCSFSQVRSFAESDLFLIVSVANLGFCFAAKA